MDREHQEPPQQRGSSQGPQNPTGWQYEEKQPGTPPRRSTAPLISSHSGPLASNAYSPNQPNGPAPYFEPVADMGTTLGYGQGMEYQYFQPSQPLPKLRQERLQQLRQDRLRRDGQHARPDVTTAIRRRKGNPSVPVKAIQSPFPASSNLASPISKSVSQPLKHSSPVV